MASLVVLLNVMAVRALSAGGTDSSKSRIQNLNSTSVSAFADSEIPSAMRDGKIPGAVLVVARDGQVICEKAYGVADLETRQPVSTEQTLFRVASISKILTAASALQLVQAGRLDLHRNVNDYLTRLRIAPTFGEPVTLFNLLTHSGGFDECEFGYATRSAADKLALRDYLVRNQPARVRPPGEFSVYDNYGFALAGYLVQKASGIAFPDYVQERILAPLGMEHSCFSPDQAQRKSLATGYWIDDGTPRACGRNYINITPAAGFCTTASDMSEFLLALLANRRPDGSKMFSNSVINGLETGQFAPQPDLPGRCYGFNQIILAGRSALRQPGQWPGFNSVLLLFPKQRCGLFLAYNLCDYGSMERRISRAFAETFVNPDWPAVGPGAAPAAPGEDSFAALLGSYQSSRSAHEAPELTLPREIEVKRSNDGNLAINGAPYREIEPLVFERIHAANSTAGGLGWRVAFNLADDGRTVHLISQSDTFRRASWFESRHGRRILQLATSIVFLSALVLWPVMALARLVFAANPREPSWQLPGRRTRISLIVRGTAFLACLLALWFEISFGLAALRLKPFAGLYGFPASLHHLLWALPVLLVLAGVLAFFCLIIWRQRLWHPAHRWHYTLLTCMLGVFLYLFYSRHLLFIG